ncbi:MAG: alpha/beta fold hydrolase [Hyphomicrobiales bacterium]|nr:alpha/beta fold hydrolase [Alphaproteobacteria bacterium]
METAVSFDSAGLKLVGDLHSPDGLKPGERRPAILVLHGFGTSKDSGTTKGSAQLFAELGYIALRFDMRGCGGSEGKRGHVLCLDQVEDTKAALTYMANRSDVDPKRIAVMGHSFGAAVAVYTGGTDPRVAAVISSGGWGNGEVKFRGQHSSPEAWKRFTDMLAEGKRRNAKGETLMVPRWDIVPIPEHLRANLPPDSINEFPSETAQSMFDFRPNDVVGKIAPRPLLLFHSANDSVTPTSQSVKLFELSKQPTDLMLLAEIDHFPFSDKNPRARQVLTGWLGRFFPVKM